MPNQEEQSEGLEAAIREDPKGDDSKPAVDVTFGSPRFRFVSISERAKGVGAANEAILRAGFRRLGGGELEALGVRCGTVFVHEAKELRCSREVHADDRHWNTEGGNHWKWQATPAEADRDLAQRLLSDLRSRCLAQLQSADDLEKLQKAILSAFPDPSDATSHNGIRLDYLLGRLGSVALQLEGLHAMPAEKENDQLRADVVEATKSADTLAEQLADAKGQIQDLEREVEGLKTSALKLEELEKELGDALRKTHGGVRVCEGGGPENLGASVAVTLAKLTGEIEELTAKAAKKNDEASEMYARAWERELGPHRIGKRHLIDGLVLGTQNLREKAEKLPALEAELVHQKLENKLLADTFANLRRFVGETVKKNGDSYQALRLVLRTIGGDL